MSPANEVAWSEPWRKNFHCKPYDGDRTDAMRFMREFSEVSVLIEADDEYAVQDVLFGRDRGGNHALAPPLPPPQAGNPPAPNPAHALAVNAMRKRKRKTGAIILKYMVNCEMLKQTLRQHLGDGYEMWQLWMRTQIETPTESSAEAIKMVINSASMLGAVGYHKGALQSLKSWLDAENAKIQTVEDRVSEHQLAVRILDMLVKANVTYISGKAMEEFNRPPARREYTQLNAGRGNPGDPPVGARSVDAVVAAFGQLWDSSIDSGAIAQRPAGGKPGIGHSTRVDGQQLALHAITSDKTTALEDRLHQVLNDQVADHLLSAEAVNAFWETAPSEPEMRQVLEFAISTKPPIDKRAERMCFNCFGFGHIKRDCPSVLYKRDLLNIIQILTAIQAKGGKNSIPVDAFNSPRGRGAPPSSSARPSPVRKPFWKRPGRNLRLLADGSGYVDDDGNAFQLESHPQATDQEHGAGIDTAAQDDGNDGDWATAGAGAITTEADSGRGPVPEAAREAATPVSSDPFADSDPFSGELDSLQFCPPCENSSQTKTKPTKTRGAGSMLKRGLLALLTLASPAKVNAAMVAPRKPGSGVLLSGRVSTIAGHSVSAATLVSDSLLENSGYEVRHIHGVGADLDTADALLLARAAWTIDSGADVHASCNLNDITHITEMMPKLIVRVADGTAHRAAAVGSSVQIVKKRASGFKMGMVLSAMYAFPTLAPESPRFGEGAKQGARLFSVKQAFARDGIETFFNGDNLIRLPPDRKGRRRTVHFEEHPSKHLIVGEPVPKTPAPPPTAAEALALAAKDIDADLMRARFCYFSLKRIILGLKHEGSPAPHPSQGGNDEDIVRAIAIGGGVRKRYNHKAGGGNAKRPPSPLAPKKYTIFGERISSDLLGPMPPSLTHGYRYAINFYDHATGKVAIYYLKSKEYQAVLAAFKQFISDHRAQLSEVGDAPLEFTSDNGNMYTSANMEDFCAGVGIKHTLAIPYEPNTLAGSERVWGILIGPSRIACAASIAGNQKRGITDSDPYQLWPFLMNQAALAHNDLPSQRFSPNVLSPNQAAKCSDGRKLIDKYRVMLCQCYVPLPDADRQSGNKLLPVAVEATYLGWDARRQGHRVYIPSLNRITTARSIRFNERVFGRLPSANAHFYYPDDDAIPDGPAHAQAAPTPAPSRTARIPVTTASPSPNGADLPIIPAAQINALHVINLAQGEEAEGIIFSSTPTGGDGWLHSVGASSVGPIPLPKTEAEALSPDNPYRDRWAAAMQADLQKRINNNAFSAPLDYTISEIKAKGYTYLDGKWVFVVKYNTDGTVKEFRARWVVKGFTMQYGTDYDDTFIGAVNMCTQRCMFAQAAKCGLPIYECDITAAFTTAKVDRKMYMKAPTGVGYPDGAIVECIMSPEGAKSGGNLFYKEHASIQTEKMGMERCQFDPNLYRRIWPNGDWLLVGILTDNALILASSATVKDNYLKEYRKHYKITGGDEVTKFNGIEVIRNGDGSIKLHQQSYIERVHAKYLPGPSRPRSCPVDTGASGHSKFMNQKGAETQEAKDAMADKDYLGLIGCLAFITNMTRPDAHFYVAFLGQFMSSPSLENYDHALNVLAYLHKTKHLGLTYEANKPMPNLNYDPPVDQDAVSGNHGFHCWSDASYGDVKSHAGHVLMYCGGAVAWASRKIRVVVLSSTESETVAGVTACKDIIFVRHILAFMGSTINGPTPLMIDSEGMWFNVRNSGVSSRTRHWEIWQHFARRCHQDRIISVHKIHTFDEVADILTKALPKSDTNYKRFRDYMMNIPASTMIATVGRLLRLVVHSTMPGIHNPNMSPAGTSASHLPHDPYKVPCYNSEDENEQDLQNEQDFQEPDELLTCPVCHSRGIAHIAGAHDNGYATNGQPICKRKHFDEEGDPPFFVPEYYCNGFECAGCGHIEECNCTVCAADCPICPKICEEHWRSNCRLCTQKFTQTDIRITEGFDRNGMTPCLPNCTGMWAWKPERLPGQTDYCLVCQARHRLNFIDRPPDMYGHD